MTTAGRHWPYKFPLWLLAVMIGLIGFNIYSVVGTLNAAAAFAELNIPFPAAGRIAFAVLWIAVLGAVVVGMLGKQRIAFKVAAPALTLYGLANLLWTLAFSKSDYSQGQIVFQGIATVLALIPVWWVALRRGWVRNNNDSLEA
jgi:hypothetical protein